MLAGWKLATSECFAEGLAAEKHTFKVRPSYRVPRVSRMLIPSGAWVS